MHKAAVSVMVFGVYLAVLGVVLVAVPNLLLAGFGLPVTAEVWIRIVGVLVLCLSFYYVQAGRHGMVEFFRWTVPVRSFVCACLVVFTVLGLAKPPLAAFGVVDLLGAIWTGATLRPPRAA